MSPRPNFSFHLPQLHFLYYLAQSQTDFPPVVTRWLLAAPASDSPGPEG